MKLIRLIIVVLCIGIILAGLVEARQTKKKPASKIQKPNIEYLSTPETKSQNLPFSNAVRVGNILYLSGEIGRMPGTLDLAPGGIEPETKQAMENIGRVLTANGLARNARVEIECIAVMK